MVTQRAHDVIITSLWRRNDVTTSFWRHNDAIIASCARWEEFQRAENSLQIYLCRSFNQQGLCYSRGARAPFQYPIRRLIVRFCEVSKSRGLYLELSDRSEIWQTPRQHCCRCNYQSLNYQSTGVFEMKHLFPYMRYASVDLHFDILIHQCGARLLTLINFNPGMFKHIPSKAWVKSLNQSGPNFNSIVEVWEWTSYFIPHFIMSVITCPYWDWS